jgi:hypothetical protein
MKNQTPPSDDYDTPWKDALTRYFPEFMAFYFPRAAAEIDWRQAHVFLDQELAQVVQDAELGKRLLDRLVQVGTYEGGEQWVYIHVEVQGQRDAHFAERLFTYNYRLYDRYRRPVASLAVLADDTESWKPDTFGYQLFGCEVGIRFPPSRSSTTAARSNPCSKTPIHSPWSPQPTSSPARQKGIRSNAIRQNGGSRSCSTNESGTNSASSTSSASSTG